MVIFKNKMSDKYIRISVAFLQKKMSMTMASQKKSTQVTKI